MPDPPSSIGAEAFRQAKLISQDPLTLFSRIVTKLNTIWLNQTYPFARFGKHVSVHPSCEIYRAASPYIDLDNDVYLAPDVWLNIIADTQQRGPKIVLKKGCKIGRRCTISARNHIELAEDVLLAPNVLIMDHNHEYSNPDLPIHAQGVTEGGRIVIGRNCWLGHGSVIFCGKGQLTLGNNCVVGANSVVTRSFPAYSVVAGNPASLIKKYDANTQTWVKVERDNEIRA